MTNSWCRHTWIRAKLVPELKSASQPQKTMLPKPQMGYLSPPSHFAQKKVGVLQESGQRIQNSISQTPSFILLRTLKSMRCLGNRNTIFILILGLIWQRQPIFANGSFSDSLSWSYSSSSFPSWKQWRSPSSTVSLLLPHSKYLPSCLPTIHCYIACLMIHSLTPMVIVKELSAERATASLENYFQTTQNHNQEPLLKAYIFLWCLHSTSLYPSHQLQITSTHPWHKMRWFTATHFLS